MISPSDLSRIAERFSDELLGWVGSDDSVLDKADKVYALSNEDAFY